MADVGSVLIADPANQRRNDAVGELGDQRRERCADYHRDSQVDDITPREKLLGIL